MKAAVPSTLLILYRQKFNTLCTCTCNLLLAQSKFYKSTVTKTVILSLVTKIQPNNITLYRKLIF